MSAAKQKRTSTRTVVTTSASNTSASSTRPSADYPLLVETGGGEESESFSFSMSPSRRTRQLEKDTLSHLNDRLAVYIDRVRQLELENERLNVRINESEVVEKKERNDLVSRYEAKVRELRDMIDDALKEKTRISVESKSALAERDNLRGKVNKLEKELKQSEKIRISSESLIQDLQARVNTTESARRHLEDENKNLLAENDELKRQLEVLRKQVEDEVLENTALHNKHQSLKEDYEFLKKTHEGQLEEIHRKRQVEMTTTAREIERTYESRLQEQLQAMRADFDARLNKNRRDIDETYKNKLNEANEARQQMNIAREEAARLRLRIHELEKVGGGYEDRIESLNKKIADLESQLRFTRDDVEVRVGQRDKRIAELQEEINHLLNEYQDLFDLKVQLDTELKAYQNLLEGEESRLNISQQSSVSPKSLSSTAEHVFGTSLAEQTGRRAIKRKRFAASDDSLLYHNVAKTYKTTSNSDCDIEIEAHDTDGRFIKVINKGEETISIGQWAIKSVANDKETIYKFHSRQSMKPGDTITVWSADTGEKHSPPSQLVMKNQQWPAGDRIKTTLVDSENVEMASRESTAEFQYGQFMSGDGQDPDQRCAIIASKTSSVANERNGNMELKSLPSNIDNVINSIDLVTSILDDGIKKLNKERFTLISNRSNGQGTKAEVLHQCSKDLLDNIAILLKDLKNAYSIVSSDVFTTKSKLPIKGTSIHHLRLMALETDKQWTKSLNRQKRSNDNKQTNSSSTEATQSENGIFDEFVNFAGWEDFEEIDREALKAFGIRPSRVEIPSINKN